MKILGSISHIKENYTTTENKLKEGIFIIEITKVVAHRLHDGYGVPWRDGGISTTFGNSKRKKYFLCESKKNLLLLSKVMTEENM